MARAPNPKIKEAEALYKQGKPLVEVAKILDMPEGTVRRWKHEKKWSKKKESERSEKKKNVRKRGAPYGSQNAKGARGNPHPVPPIKHGAYSKVYWDVLDDDEKDLIIDIPQDEETLLIEQIQLFTIRERRILKAINKYRLSKEQLAIEEVSREEIKRSFESEEEKEKYKASLEKKVDKGRLPGQAYNLKTTTVNKDNTIIRLEAELSSVQSKKTKAIEALARLNLEKEKMSGDSKENDMVKLWADKIRTMRKG